MKIILLLPILVSIIVIESCKSSTKKDENLFNGSICCDSVIKGERMDSTYVNIFNIDSLFLKQLDTIILEEQKCPYYTKCNSGFLFTTSLIKSESGLEEIMISAININRCDYSECSGIFAYKGYRFVCDSLSNKNYLKKTNEKLLVKYIVKDKPKRIHDIDDRFSNWLFINKNNKIICTGHYQCLNAKN